MTEEFDIPSALDEVSLEDVPEMGPVDAGEYQVEIGSSDFRQSNKNGIISRFFMVRFIIPDEPTSIPITQTIFLPRDTEGEREINAALNRVRDFCNTFGIEINKGLRTLAEEARAGVWDGQVGSVMLGQKDGKEYGLQNNVTKFLPKR